MTFLSFSLPLSLQLKERKRNPSQVLSINFSSLSVPWGLRVQDKPKYPSQAGEAEDAAQGDVEEQELAQGCLGVRAPHIQAPHLMPALETYQHHAAESMALRAVSSQKSRETRAPLGLDAS